MKKILRTFLVAAAAPLGAVNYGTPLIDATPPTVSSNVAFGGQTYVNQGLVGVGVFSPNLLDGRGDTFGSFSSFKVDYSSWRRNPDGSYAGTLFTLPDRGYNVAGLIAYPARIQQLALAFTPDYTANAVAQSQLSLTFQRTITVTDFAGQASTAVDPTGPTSLQGFSNVPTFGGQFSIDGEGLARRADGTFFLSDEYGATVYHLASDGRMLGVITPPQALLPQFTSASGFSGFTTSAAAVATGVQTGGRRDNQGMEAVDLTPDGRYLVTMLQSGTRQDNPTNSNQDRLFTRLMVYDLAAGSTPSSPVGHYLVELPTFDRDGTGGAADRAAAQSEILALSPSTFLVLTRDGNGNGSGDNARPLVFKTVSLVSLTGATNLAGTEYETSYTPAAAGLAGATAGITAAQATPFVNLLNAQQLARFGIDMNVGAEGTGSPVSANSLGEKWEALSLVPVLDPLAPNDYFLLVGNDNDFLGTSVTMLGGAPIDATAGASLAENPNRILVYRVTLPGYLDSGLVQNAQTSGAAMMGVSIRSVQTMGTNFTSFLGRRMTGALRLTAPLLASSDDEWLVSEDLCSLGLPATRGVAGAVGMRWWVDGSFRDISERGDGVQPTVDSEAVSGAVGIEWGLADGFSAGFGVGSQSGKSDGSDNSALEYDGISVTAYLLGRWEKSFGSISATYGRQDFGLLQRAGAYGSAPFGRTEGKSYSVEASYGATVAEYQEWAFTPVVGLSHSRMNVDAYGETGGFGPLAFPKQSLERSMASASLEAARSVQAAGGLVTPFIRAGFDHEFGGSGQVVNASIVSGSGAGSSIAIALPNTDRDYAVGGAGVRWDFGGLRGEVSYEHRSGDSGYREHRVNFGLSSAF